MAVLDLPTRAGVVLAVSARADNGYQGWNVRFSGVRDVLVRHRRQLLEVQRGAEDDLSIVLIVQALVDMTDTLLYLITRALTQMSLADSIREVQKAGGAQDQLARDTAVALQGVEEVRTVLTSMTLDLMQIGNGTDQLKPSAARDLLKTIHRDLVQHMNLVESFENELKKDLTNVRER